MNIYVKKFLLRGLVFSGLGPIVCGIVFWCLDLANVAENITGGQMLLAIITTYVIAFIHAGSSIFPTIEKWSKLKAMAIQGISLYSVYTIGYLINNWIPFDWKIIAIYTGIFLLGFLLIWAIAYFTTRAIGNSLNKRLAELNKNDLN